MKWGDLRSACHDGSCEDVMNVLSQFEGEPHEALGYVYGFEDKRNIISTWSGVGFPFAARKFADANIGGIEPFEVSGFVNINQTPIKLVCVKTSMRLHQKWCLEKIKKTTMEESILPYIDGVMKSFPEDHKVLSSLHNQASDARIVTVRLFELMEKISKIEHTLDDIFGKVPIIRSVVKTFPKMEDWYSFRDEFLRTRSTLMMLLRNVNGTSAPSSEDQNLASSIGAFCSVNVGESTFKMASTGVPMSDLEADLQNYLITKLGWNAFYER